jgi:chromosome partitioning protein
VRVIVVGNEKGGAGKSTIAVHLAVALAHEGAAVAVLDLDRRQRSLDHFFASRAAWIEANQAELPQPRRLGDVADAADLDAALPAVSGADFLIVDTPGADTELSRAAHQRADLIITPMNDSFVDFHVLGVVDPVTLNLVRPSLYAETVWEARKLCAAERGRSLDWVVLHNRLASSDPRNRRRVDERVAALARRVGFRTLHGLRDRVIYRELYPFGLTVADLGPKVRPVPVSIGHVAARQEMRALLGDLRLAAAPGAGIAAE